MADVLSLITNGFVKTDGATTTVVITREGPPQLVLVPQPVQQLPEAKPTTSDIANTGARGIFQSAVIIRSAMQAALQDLRANPFLLDYAFASLAQDELTADKNGYGEQQIERAKQWFLAQTKIPVVMNTRYGDPYFPCISIELRESIEDENTLGDMDPENPLGEDLPSFNPIIAGPFSATSYDVNTGALVVPDSVVLKAVRISKSMSVVDATGLAHQILDTKGSNTILIAPGTQGDFSRAQLKGAAPSVRMRLESASFRESYAIGCHVQGEPAHLTYLFSIVAFALLRYREELLEARGFERSRVQASEEKVNENFEQEKHYIYSRYVSLSGYARNYWPKSFEQKVTATTFDLRANADPHPPIELISF